MSDITTSLLARLITKQVRALMNGALAQFTPGDVRDAIRNNLSLWGVGEVDIQFLASKVPGVAEYGQRIIKNIESEYGSVLNLVIEWLKEDQKAKYSVIVNTPGGVEWLAKQVNDILTGLGIYQ